MRIARLLFFSAAFLSSAAAQSWDNSGNGMLSGTYYFREVFYIVGDNAGDLQGAIALYNTVTFDGNGKYTMSAIEARSDTGSLLSGTLTGTYSIAASGQGFLSNPLSSGDLIYGVVAQSGIFVGSSTESSFNDLFIAVPASSPAPTNATFRGSYTIGLIDLTDALYFVGGVPYALDAMFQMSPDGAGNLGTINISGYVGGGGSNVFTQSAAGLKYSFSNGVGSVAFPTSSSATLVSGAKTFYVSPDGSFVFGGSPGGFDMFVGVRQDSAIPSFNGLYVQAGIDEDESNLSLGYALLDTYFGSLSAGGGQLVGHQRQSDVFFNYSTALTYSDSYTLKSDGTYSSNGINYAVGAGGTVRIGVGAGPFLGLNVAVAAPAPDPKGASVYINPQGVVNAASFAPFTAGIAPGELITIYGTNLSAGNQFAPGIPFPTSLNNVQVNINGLNAPIYYVTPGQIAVIVPYAVGNSIATIQVNNNGTLSNTVTAFINLTTPGAFTIPPGGIGYGAVLHPDFTLVTKDHPAQIGETVSVYLTGLGGINPVVADGSAGPTSPLSTATNTIAVDISGTSAAVTYAGLAPQLAGLYQLNVTIPSGLTAGDNNLDISGPDSYATEALIPIAASSSAAPAAKILQPRARLPKGTLPTRKRPLPTKVGQALSPAQ